MKEGKGGQGKKKLVFQRSSAELEISFFDLTTAGFETPKLSSPFCSPTRQGSCHKKSVVSSTQDTIIIISSLNPHPSRMMTILGYDIACPALQNPSKN
jgi:hypothetical protein